MNSTTAILVGVLSSSVIVEIIRCIKEHFVEKKRDYQREDSLKQAVCALLRDRILHLRDKYMEQGSISQRHWQSMYMLYENYKNLGGNGFIEEEMELVKELPRT